MKELDINSRREELYDAWQRLFNLANSLLAQAEEDITSVKASMMQQIIRVLTSSGKIISDMEKFKEKVDKEPELDPETGEHKELSPEKLAEIQRLEKEYEAMKDTEGDYSDDNYDSEPETSLMDTKSGFNFKRS